MTCPPRTTLVLLLASLLLLNFSLSITNNEIRAKADRMKAKIEARAKAAAEHLAISGDLKLTPDERAVLDELKSRDIHHGWDQGKISAIIEAHAGGIDQDDETPTSNPTGQAPLNAKQPKLVGGIWY
jgi:hypothetical protein